MNGCINLLSVNLIGRLFDLSEKQLLKTRTERAKRLEKGGSGPKGLGFFVCNTDAK